MFTILGRKWRKAETKLADVITRFAGSMFFAAALGSTVTCIGIPLVFLFTGNPLGLILFWPLAMYLFGKRFKTGYTIRDAGKTDKITWKKPAVMTKVLAYYIRIMLWPNKLAFFREWGGNYTSISMTTSYQN